MNPLKSIIFCIFLFLIGINPSDGAKTVKICDLEEVPVENIYVQKSDNGSAMFLFQVRDRNYCFSGLPFLGSLNHVPADKNYWHSVFSLGKKIPSENITSIYHLSLRLKDEHTGRLYFLRFPTLHEQNENNENNENIVDHRMLLPEQFVTEEAWLKPLYSNINLGGGMLAAIEGLAFSYFLAPWIYQKTYALFTWGNPTTPLNKTLSIRGYSFNYAQVGAFFVASFFTAGSMLATFMLTNMFLIWKYIPSHLR